MQNILLQLQANTIQSKESILKNNILLGLKGGTQQLKPIFINKKEQIQNIDFKGKIWASRPNKTQRAEKIKLLEDISSKNKEEIKESKNIIETSQKKTKSILKYKQRKVKTQNNQVQVQNNTYCRSNSIGSPNNPNIQFSKRRTLFTDSDKLQCPQFTHLLNQMTERSSRCKQMQHTDSNRIQQQTYQLPNQIHKELLKLKQLLKHVSGS